LLGKRKVNISISDGSLVRASLNGKEIGILGKKEEKLENLIFLPENK
jgi:hypothetical protein